MSTKLPYMTSSGLIPKILEKIQVAKRPERFTQDFLETKLGHPGGSARSIIPLLKRLEFLGSDGSPTDLYNQFRNAETQGIALAQGMKKAFSQLFERNEYVYDLDRPKLTSLIVEITGRAKGDPMVRAIVGTFLKLKDLADFESDIPLEPEDETENRESQTPRMPATTDVTQPLTPRSDVGLNISYTIKLNLPETTDPNVFNAIFKALRENLLEN